MGGVGAFTRVQCMHIVQDEQTPVQRLTDVIGMSETHYWRCTPALTYEMHMALSLAGVVCVALLACLFSAFACSQGV
jgi:hypothetical protein